MIIIGTYPELVGSPENGTPIQRLRHVVDATLPSDVVLHLLPPYPASGDGGFAADDWFSVRADLGSWSDLVDWASTRNLILDGIYNHVGRDHLLAAEFLASPSEHGPIYAYRGSEPPSSQCSPRGGSVFRKHQIAGDAWQVWQTFSETSLDIRLTHPRVRAEIVRHLQFLADSGIYGVRLDGCAYYGHDLAVDQFHNPAARLLAQSLAREAQARGLFVVAQLDSDPVGSSYFPKAEGWSVPAVDYAYSAVLVRSLLAESASAMEMHIQRTLRLPCEVLRPPRTHDGILLQSDLLTNDELDDLARHCDRWNLPVRSANGESYEINSSLPYICSLGVGEEGTWQRVLLVIALTGFLPGTPYFYLPFAICDVPEHRTSVLDTDPRSLNRSRLLETQIEKFSMSSRGAQLRAILRAISKTRALHSDDDVKAAVPSTSPPDSVIVVSRDADRCVFACNFSTSHAITLQLPYNMRFCWGIGASSHTLDPLGFGVWRQDTFAE